MKPNSSVLLIEHLDATGAAPSDARARALACRAAGLKVETLVLDGQQGDDLLFPTRGARAGTTIEIIPGDDTGLRELGSRVRASRADHVLWASAVRGGGSLARRVVGERPASWWPTGHEGTSAEPGSLAPLDNGFAPCAGSAWDAERVARGQLSLWDGPFVLAPSRPAPASARLLFGAFAQACENRDELDLVVLDHARPELETLARQAGVALRVHFVGPAPREAELSWLASARLALVTGDAPLSGGMLLRALGAGLPVLAVGASSRPIGEWLHAAGAGPAAYESEGLLAEALGPMLDRVGGALAWPDRARAAAAGHSPARLAGRVAVAIGAPTAGRRAA